MKEYRGGCHCGLIAVSYRTAVDPADWSLRHDGCSFCRRHGVVGTSDSNGKIAFDIADASKTRRYRFGHRSAEFLLCAECGVFVAAISDTPEGPRAVLNVRVLDSVSLDFEKVTRAQLDGETPAERASRRLRHWTPLELPQN